VKDPFKLLGIEEEGPDGADVGYGYLCDELTINPRKSDLICKTCRPEFRVLWQQQMDPRPGKPRQLNKGTLRTHMKN